MTSPHTSLPSVVGPPPDVNPRAEPVLDFAERPLEAMTPADYAELGFMSGLEVHQQLRTERKLFCRCPAARRTTRVDAEVLRHMRPTLSELGEYDGTALMEFKTRKEIVYLLERGSVCTYEMDDTPPFEIDMEAVRIALEIAELAGLSLVSELHVMRKQYLDGSIPTGFQRTAMVGLGGRIPFRVPELDVDRDLGIRQLSLEEDSCREVTDVGHRITFRTDRLGMPLTELVTEPELSTPRELQAAGRLLADLARSTDRVLRGPGAGRQDVNVSVAGGRRIEIKGVHHHARLPRLVHTEAFRQLELLRVKAELERRGVTVDTIPVPDAGPAAEGRSVDRLLTDSRLVVDARTAVSGSTYQPLRQALGRGERALAVRLPGFAGLLTHRTQPGVTFSRELAERVRVIACPVHRPFMTHSDLGQESLAGHQWSRLRKALGAGTEDAVVVVWAPELDAATAAREILIRAGEALAGIPAETRQAFADGTTGFERILPGADRMYPDTDTPPLALSDELLAEVRSRMGEAPWERERRYRTLGVPDAMARRLARAPWAGLFDALDPAGGEVARRLAGVLEKRIPHQARRHGRARRPEWGRAPESMLPSPARLAPLVRALEEGRLRLDGLAWAFDAVMDDCWPVASDGGEPDEAGRAAERVLERFRPLDVDAPDVRARVAEVTERARERFGGGGPPTGDASTPAFRWAVGRVMRPFPGRLDPGAVRKAVRAGLAGPDVGPAGSTADLAPGTARPAPEGASPTGHEP